MELHLKIAGAILIFLGFMHIAFPKYFNWKKELSQLSLINNQMMYVHTFFLALTVLICCGIVIGFENINANQVRVYPNPATENISIALGNNFNGSIIQLFNLNGEKVIENKIINSIETIDMSGFAKGVYTLRITSASSSVNRWIECRCRCPAPAGG